MAFGCLALTYSMRHSDPLGELLPDAFPLAAANAVRGWPCLVYSVVRGGQLRHNDPRLLLPVDLFPKDGQVNSRPTSSTGSGPNCLRDFLRK